VTLFGRTDKNINTGLLELGAPLGRIQEIGPRENNGSPSSVGLFYYFKSFRVAIRQKYPRGERAIRVVHC
jgi:hypothetical protein